MDYIIKGKNRLNGEIPVYGAKNCALALLGASVLTEEEIVLTNCPKIVDVENMLLLLKAMGKRVARHRDTVSVGGSFTTTDAPAELATLLRGSALILGSTVAKYNRIDLPLPGGCAIGARPMDIHLKGLEALGVEVDCDDCSLKCCGRPVGATYRMRFASVGATENLVCACVLAEGESVLQNCATEPEVVAFEKMLVNMGAKIEGIGTTELYVTGVKELHGTQFDVIPDRIVAATYLSAAVASFGEIVVTNCCSQHLTSFLHILQTRFPLQVFDDAVRIRVDKQPADYGKIITAPYPFFPTDMQSLVLSLATFSEKGKTQIFEKLFENRLNHNANELRKMGANVTVEGDKAVVIGVNRLHGAQVCAADLRGGAGLVIAALNADGESKVSDVYHIDRGYCDLAENLRSLGADITIVS